MLIGRACLFLLALAAFLSTAVSQPALIPEPRQLQWTGTDFDCQRYRLEATNVSPFVREQLEGVLRAAGAQPAPDGNPIILRLGQQRSADAPSAGKSEIRGRGVRAPEDYRLDVSAREVRLTAPDNAGLFYGVQTLRQLLVQKDGKPLLAGCRIADAPAFPWRGFMHDVGRNFQDVALLKRFIDVLAQYKLNVFHFHLTDHPGYRLECRVHPELNDPKSYLPTRCPGKFYTYAELNDLIDYCRQRHILLVPEIDMPGHSDYFKRAFGVDMQDPKGMQLLDEVLNEFFAQVDVPYLHIGSDEVNLKNKEFLPHMTALARRHGKEVLVWRPGGLPDNQAITQLWQGQTQPAPGVRYLDSRGNYLNHLDPFEAPLLLFMQQPCGVPRATDTALGAILCHWPDLNAGEPMNVYRQSPVFPALLAAAERYWLGAPTNRFDCWAKLPATNDPAFAAFARFEQRLLAHRDAFFPDWPFPYVKQTEIVWKLLGPFDHKGNVDAVFPVETELRDEYEVDGQKYRWTEARGATIYVNHFFGFPAWLPPSRQGTAYALTYVWSPRAQSVGFWLNFNGPSRSDRRGGPNPQPGHWSTTGSRLWLNDNEIPAPAWQHPGALPQPTETPFLDEDYFYRTPTPLSLQPGWNKLLVKAPKSTKTWKWNFTCVPVRVEDGQVREVPGLRFATRPENPL